MTIRQFLGIISFGTLLCWGAFLLILFNIDPFQANTLLISFFYISLFLGLIGTITAILYAWYHIFGDVQIPVFRHVKKSIGSGFFIALIFTLLLFLQRMRGLNLWSGAFIILLISFFVSLKFSKKTRKV